MTPKNEVIALPDGVAPNVVVRQPIGRARGVLVLGRGGG
jgi:hypothetical protein